MKYVFIIFLGLISLKLTHIMEISWWIIFAPLYLYFMFFGFLIWATLRGVVIKHVRYNKD